MGDRVILHSDINCCYASIEHLHHPELAGKPLAVGGDPEARHGIVLTADYIAKKYGVKTGMALWQAKQICPDITFVSPRMDLYLRFSRMAHEIYAEYTDRQEPYGIDECWLDVTGSSSLKGDGLLIAQEISRRMKSELGITVSVGVSFNKIFAKLGSDYKKPDAITTMYKSEFKQKAWSLPVADLLYVGKSTNRKLALFGIKTIGDLARADEDVLNSHLGKMGSILWSFANGYDDSPVKLENAHAPIKSVGNSTTTPKDLVCDEDVKIVLYILAESVAARLRENGFQCRVVEISVRDNELFSFTRQKKIDHATNITGEIAAYQTFKWSSESSTQAAVHCVIVGFAQFNRNEKRLFSTEATSKIVSNISPYLVEGSDTFVVAMKESLDGMPKMSFGNQPRDGGNFVIKEEEYQEIMRKEPELKKWIHPYIGADEFIKGKKRWCLWLKHVSSKEIVRSKILSEKVERVRQFRLSSKAKTTNGYAKVPQLFAQITQPDDVDFLIIPRVSSERRRYVPIGFATKDIISSDAVQIVPNATLYHFGVLTSNVHMAWMRAVCGRLKSDYRYSKEIVYNTFPWPKPTEEQRIKIEQTAQVILNAREQYSDCSLADMYGEKMYLFPELVKAHQDNDRAVMQAYGFTKGREAYKSEAACVAELMKLYQKKVEELEKR